MAQPILTPILFGKYELLDRLAVGGMAEIFLARSASLGGVTRTCVIKRILPQHCANRQFVSMFIDEARIMIGLDHPNIVKLFDFGQIDGAYYMTMEFVDGFDLVAVMLQVAKHNSSVAPMAAAYLARCMASALGSAHNLTDHRNRQLGVVHRDVSPHNVLLSHDGDVKLTDFGIALAKNKLTHTVPGTVMGKFAYMPPEQALAEPVDARSDLFSVGVVLHEMLSGQRLFSAETPVLTITRVIESDIEPPSWIQAKVPECLDRVTLKALKRDPDERYQSGDEFVAALDPILEAEGFGQQQFADYLAELQITRTGAPALNRRPKPNYKSLVAGGPDNDAELNALKKELASDPNVWTLAAIGERLLAIGERVRSMAVLRTAAAVFAHRGMLVQAIVALEPIRHLCDEMQRQRDLLALAGLRSGVRADLLQFVKKLDGGDAFALLRSVDESGLGSDRDEQTVLPAPTPLLGYVTPEEFARLVESGRIRHLTVGDLVVREGDLGDTLFAIGRGRVVVYCSPPSGDEAVGDDGRIYLSSLAEGDCFGEFGFLTGSQRTATVEVISDSWLFELDRATVEGLVELTPEIAGTLLDFYKERVAELLMAKSPVFAVLEPHQRKVLLARAVLERFADNEMIVEEHDASSSLYFIKRGEVEIYTERDGLPIFLNKLTEGDFFGEMSTIRQSKRTASVRSIGDVELLRLSGEDLQQLIDQEPRVSKALKRAADERAQESEHLIAEGLDLLQRL